MSFTSWAARLFFTLLLGPIIILVWLLVFEAIDRTMAEREKVFQECGGKYCPMSEYDEGGKS